MINRFNYILFLHKGLVIFVDLLAPVEEFKNESRDSVRFNTMYETQIVFGR